VDVDIKRRWIAALRSGEYAQGRAWLRRNDAYCCLGVLCELAAHEGITKKSTPDDDGVVTYGPTRARKRRGDEITESSTTSLPEAVVVWSGVADPHSWQLTKLNDDGATFAEIADFLEGKIALDELTEITGGRNDE